MNIVDLIIKKKNRFNISESEFDFFIKGVLDNSIKDYQISAFMMAICFNGLNEDESFYLFLKKVLRSSYPYKDTYRLIKEYWKENHFQSHSITLLLKLIKIRILHIKD